MSNKILDTLKKIKQAFEEAQPQSFEDYTLKDGTVVSVSELVAGGTAMIGDQPAPAGEHELSDGTIIVVAEAGVISEVKAPAAAPAEPGEGAEAEDMAKTKGPDYSQKFEAIEARFATMEQTIQSFDAALKQSGETVKQLLSLVEELASTPAAEPAAAPKQNFSKAQPVTGMEKYRRIAQAVNKIANN